MATSEQAAVTGDEIAAVERRVMMQLTRAIDEATRLSDATERTLAAQRVAHLSAALVSLRAAGVR